MSSTAVLSRSAARQEWDERLRAGRRLLVVRITLVLLLIAAAALLAAAWFSALTAPPSFLTLAPAALGTYAAACLAGLVWILWAAAPAIPPSVWVEAEGLDVLLTATGRPVGTVAAAIESARALRGCSSVLVVDAVDREEVRLEAEGVGAVYRAGGRAEIDAAVAATQGEYLLVLGAEQDVQPALVERALRSFDDPRLAFVRLGGRSAAAAVLIAGLAGRRALPFAGTAVVVRRDAFMQLAIAGYAHAVEKSVRRALNRADGVLERALETDSGREPVLSAALDTLRRRLAEARAAVRAGEPIGLVTFELQQAVSRLSRDVVAIQLHASVVDLAAMSEADLVGLAADAVPAFDFADAIGELADGEHSPLAALAEVHDLVRSIDIDLGADIEPVLPILTTDTVEDRRTSLRLQAAGLRGGALSGAIATRLGAAPVRPRRSRTVRSALAAATALGARGLTLGQRLVAVNGLRAPVTAAALAGVLAVPVAALLAGQPADGALFAASGFFAAVLAADLAASFVLGGLGRRVPSETRGI